MALSYTTAFSRARGFKKTKKNIEGIHKLLLQIEVGIFPQNLSFFQQSYCRKCQRREVGGHTKPKTCQRIL